MKFARTWLLVAVALLGVAAGAAAQDTNGTISGHVSDQQGLALPGVTVNASSPNLQGIRTVVTSENGDYVLSALPPGTYTLTFELMGFESHRRTATLAATQNLPIDVQLGAGGINETVNVVGTAPSLLTQTAMVGVDFKQDMISTLPTNRSLDSVLLISPAIHASGPNGAYSISGAMSFESAFLVNGVNVNENIRGQALSPYIEDAVQETTVATDGISAEFGHFSGGVVNVITKSGGNTFSGSFRDTLNNDNWRSYVTGTAAHPWTSDCDTCGPNGTPSKVNLVVPQYEYTIGGPIMKDHLWFFNAGRFVDQQSSMSTIAPLNIPYVQDLNRKRYEIKLTESVTSSHRIQAAYARENLDVLNTSQSATSSMDLASLYNASQPTGLFTASYDGVMSPSLVIEARYSRRTLDLGHAGAPSTDRILGTLLLDRARGGRYFAPTFCVCNNDERDNDDYFAKGTYFKSTKHNGSHSIVFGVDSFNDMRRTDNHQSGSDYRINGTTSIIVGQTIYPSWNPGPTTVLQYNPISSASLGTNFRTNGLFFNDSWRMNGKLTLNLGVRWDKNHGVDSAGNLVASDSLTSPRVGVVWDPKGDGKWSVNANISRYVANLSDTIADGSSAAGNPATLQWTYNGPAINPIGTPTANLINSPAAIQMMFNWCAPNAQGFCTSTAPTTAQFPGVSVKIPNGLTSPNVRAYGAGVSRQFGSRAAIRIDYTYRDYHDFYSQRIDTTTGVAVDQLGNRADLAVVENTDALKRRYQGLTVQSTYRVSSRTDVGGNYTLSRLWGNFDGENLGSGPISTDLFQYPEYRQASWYAPIGDLSLDQRHRTSLWINYGVPRIEGLTLSLLDSFASGLPYGAVGVIDARPYVDPAVAAKYVTPQGGSSETYYYTNRDAYRTDGYNRADFAATYNYSIGAGMRKIDLFVQAQVLNVLNEQDLCGCGGTVFLNGGNVVATRVSGTSQNQSIVTPVSSATMQKFNPFTTQPIQGVNWDTTSTFGTPLSRFAYTSPREFRMSFGVRF